MTERRPPVSWLDREILPARPKRRVRGPRKKIEQTSVTSVTSVTTLTNGVPKPPLPRPRPEPPPPPEPPRPAARRQARPKQEPEATSADIARWITERCYVPEGRKFGQLFTLDDWQIELLQAIYDNPHGPTRRAILSMARKNGKTCLAALLLLCHLCGPKNRYNSQLYSAAQSREQAGLIFNMAAKIVRMSPELRGGVVIRESTKTLRCPELGTSYRALAAEATTAFGLSPVFTIHDELGLVRGPRSELYEALETATGAQAEPLSIVISTQAPTDGDLLSILIDDALAGHDPAVVCKLFTAAPELDPFDINTIKLSNPSLGVFLSEKEVLAQANDAKRMPARESEYRNLILNQRVVVENPFIAPAVWNACGDPVEPVEGVDLYGGLDLSEVADLTALVLIGQVNNKWHVRPTFWLPIEGLSERAAADRVPYDLWHSQGHLQATPGKTVSYEFVAHHLRQLFQRYNIQKLAFDRWNFRHLRPWLLQAGFTEHMVTDRFVEFGQGVASMSPALRDLEQALLEGHLVHGGHPVLSMCVSHAVVVLDDAGNRKLSKKKSSARIDGAIALAMAIGVAPLQAKPIDIEALIA
jgi:phage terminase large subunit-like protein